MVSQSFGSNRASQYFYQTDSPSYLITFGNGLVVNNPTIRAEDVLATYNPALILPANFSYTFSGSLSIFEATFAIGANFTPTYVALLAGSLPNNFDYLLAINAFSTPLIAGQNKTVKFKFKGIAI